MHINPLQRHQDNQKKGLHIRPREQESGGEDPQAKVLKPYRVTRPREAETEGDKPPSKVLKPCIVTRPREAETEGDKPPSKVLKPCRITCPREAETEVDKPPSKVLKPCRVTHPREGETEGDKPPSKVHKSMQWVKSLFVRAPPLQGVPPGQDKEKLTPTGNDGENASTKNGNRSQPRIRTGTSSSSPPSNTHGGGLVVNDNPEVHIPSINLITTSGFLLHLYHFFNRTKRYGGILAIIMIVMQNRVQARPNPNTRQSKSGEEFGLNHRFTAYDCDHPTTVQALKLPAHCLTPKTDRDSVNQTTNLLTHDKDLYQILQKATYYEFDAHQCIQTRSRFFYNCVWASHVVISGVPETAQVIPPTIEFCRQAVRTQSYITTTGDTVALKDDGLPTYIKEVINRELTVAKGAVNCLGEEVKHQGTLFKQSVILQETHFTIRKVKIRKNFDSGDLMLVESSTMIPAHLVGTGCFAIDSGTYIIPQIKTPCAYQIIKEFLGSGTPTDKPDDLILTSQKGQVHLHTHGRLNPPDRCPIQGAYLKTGHLNIIVFSQTDGPRTAEDYRFDNIDARQVSIPSMIALKVEWALYQTSKKFGLVHNVLSTDRMQSPQAIDQWRPEPT